MELFIARQPIFNCKKDVVAYEMLYRSGPGAQAFDGSDGATATRKVINALFYSPEGSALLGGKLAFINFPQSLLVDEAARLLPSRKVVLEVLENVEPSEAVLAACRALRTQQYQFALDDVVRSDQQHALADLAAYIKVDFRSTTVEERTRIADRFRKSKTLLAEKVETQDELDWGLKNGFTMFQGYFFSKPVTSRVRDIPGSKLNYLEILRRIYEPELNFEKLADLVRREAALSYKVLRAANSVLYGSRAPATSVDRAMSRLGENEVKKLLSVVVMMDLADDPLGEPMVGALVRAKFAELLAMETRLKGRAEELFTLGLFSRLDSVIGRPLEEIVNSINLPKDIRQAMLRPGDGADDISTLWSMLLAYEAGNFESATALMAGLDLKHETIHQLYARAAHWAHTALHR